VGYGTVTAPSVNVHDFQTPGGPLLEQYTRARPKKSRPRLEPAAKIRRVRNSAHELAIWIKDRNPSGGDRCVLLYFNQKQYQTFEKVMEKHQATRGSRGWGGKEKILAKLMRADLKNSDG
jgi:hypothetical protein